MNKTKIMVECAVLIAIGTVLANIKVYELPNGGALTAASMLPFMIISFRHGVKWGVLSGIVNSLLQMVLGGLYAPPSGTAIAFIGMILLDYVIAFTVLGLADVFAKPFGNRLIGVSFGIIVSGLLRFLCSFLSGILLWGSYAPEDTPVWLYSLTYNASYMIPEIIICVVAGIVLYITLPKIYSSESIA